MDDSVSKHLKLKNMAQYQARRERKGQAYWFSPQGTTPYPATTPVNRASADRSVQKTSSQRSLQNLPDYQHVQPQSRLDAILDLLALGSTHYINNRRG